MLAVRSFPLRLVPVLPPGGSPLRLLYHSPTRTPALIAAVLAPVNVRVIFTHRGVFAPPPFTVRLSSLSDKTTKGTHATRAL